MGTFVLTAYRVVEVLAEAEYDFVFIDAEYFMKKPKIIEQMMTACEAVSITPFLRVQDNL